jgi:hypothetical protein
MPALQPPRVRRKLAEAAMQSRNGQAWGEVLGLEMSGPQKWAAWIRYDGG